MCAFAFRGDLREFPFADPSRGEFSVAARIERGVLPVRGRLAAHREHPGRAALRARAHAHRRDERQHLGVALANVEVAFQAARPSPLLEVSGERAGATADFLRFIESSRCAA
jgi:hypothetical protein